MSDFHPSLPSDFAPLQTWGAGVTMVTAMSLWLRSLLAVFAAVVGLIAGLMGAGGIAGGFAWIFLFGDNPWPPWSDSVILAAALIGGVAVATLLGISVWRATAPKKV